MEKKAKIALAAGGSVVALASVGVIAAQAKGSHKEPSSVRQTSFTVVFTGDVDRCTFTVDGTARALTDQERSERKVSISATQNVTAKCGIYKCSCSTSGQYAVKRLTGFTAVGE